MLSWSSERSKLEVSPGKLLGAESAFFERLCVVLRAVVMRTTDFGDARRSVSPGKP